MVMFETYASKSKHWLCFGELNVF